MSVRGVAARWSTTRSRCPMTCVTRSLGVPEKLGGATQPGWGLLQTILAKPLRPTWFLRAQIVSSLSGAMERYRSLRTDCAIGDPDGSGAGWHRKPAGPQPGDSTVWI
jgi:hypothetical protein